MDGLPEIAEVKRLTPRPGDTLVVRLHRRPDMWEASQIKAQVRAAVGDVSVLVLGPEDDIEVIEHAGDGT